MTKREAIEILKQGYAKKPHTLWSIKFKKACEMAIDALSDGDLCPYDGKICDNKKCAHCPVQMREQRWMEELDKEEEEACNTL